jgi:mannose/fructose/N-acetylgalactosamine-specific phosphotransferase system component IID
LEPDWLLQFSAKAEAKVLEGTRHAATLKADAIIETDCKHVVNFSLSEGRCIADNTENMKILNITKSTKQLLPAYSHVVMQCSVMHLSACWSKRCLIVIGITILGLILTTLSITKQKRSRTSLTRTDDILGSFFTLPKDIEI